MIKWSLFEGCKVIPTLKISMTTILTDLMKKIIKSHQLIQKKHLMFKTPIGEQFRIGMRENLSQHTKSIQKKKKKFPNSIILKWEIVLEIPHEDWGEVGRMPILPYT